MSREHPDREDYDKGNCLDDFMREAAIKHPNAFKLRPEIQAKVDALKARKQPKQNAA